MSRGFRLRGVDLANSVDFGEAPRRNGRDGEIRTRDLLRPRQAR